MTAGAAPGVLRRREDLEDVQFPRETIHSGTDLGGLEIKTDTEGEEEDESDEQEYEEADQFIPRGSYFDRSIELENILELPNESGSEADDQQTYEIQHHDFQNDSDSDEERFRKNDFFQRDARFRSKRRRRRAKDDQHSRRRSPPGE